MDPSSESEVILDCPFFRVYKDGHVDRLAGTDTVPPGVDAATGVTSKDVVIDGDTGVYVRLYLPDVAGRSDTGKKLPVLVYFHGGGFIIGSAASPAHHGFLNSLVARAGVLAVSVNYRLAPEHPLPAGFEDSFRALKWAASGADDWLSRHGDLRRVFLAGDSAGGNIAHNVAMMAGVEGSDTAARIEGAVVIHAGFGGRETIAGEPPEWRALAEKLWSVVCPEAADGLDDPRLNPLAAAAPGLQNLACKRLLVCAADRDAGRARKRAYYEAVAASGWRGAVEWFESKDEEHVFFLLKPGCPEAAALMDRLVAFFAEAGN